MSVTTALRINMTGMSDDPAEESRRYRAALEMAAHAEASGFDIVNLEEHHCTENGWLPSPLTLAAMIIARTRRIRVTVTALLVTLYDPVRLAEDIAILDLVSEGRFSFVAGLGYRPLEYHATGRSWEDRGRLMDETIETLLTAWKGEPFEYRGQTIRVTPRPMSRPHPFFFIGGMSAVAARRASGFPSTRRCVSRRSRRSTTPSSSASARKGSYTAPARATRCYSSKRIPNEPGETSRPTSSASCGNMESGSRRESRARAKRASRR